MSLIYEIADEYLPNKNVNGIDSPDVLLAEEIVCKVLDAAIEAINESCDEAYGWNDREHLIKALEALKEAK